LVDSIPYIIEKIIHKYNLLNHIALLYVVLTKIKTSVLQRHFFETEGLWQPPSDHHKETPLAMPVHMMDLKHLALDLMRLDCKNAHVQTVKKKAIRQENSVGFGLTRQVGPEKYWTYRVLV